MVKNKAIAMGTLLGAIAGAAAGVYLEKLWTAEPLDADDFGRRLAHLEAEIEELERLQRDKRRRKGIGAAGTSYSRMRDAGMGDPEARA